MPSQPPISSSSAERPVFRKLSRAQRAALEAQGLPVADPTPEVIEVVAEPAPAPRGPIGLPSICTVPRMVF
jgi:hypothetical protein